LKAFQYYQGWAGVIMVWEILMGQQKKLSFIIIKYHNHTKVAHTYIDTNTNLYEKWIQNFHIMTRRMSGFGH
jgi:hypothetical protein